MDTTRKKILIIAYVFPPIAYAGTHRTLRLCKYLSRLGDELHVITIKVQRDLHNDFDLLNKVKNEVTIHRTKTIDVWRYYQKYKGRFLKTKTGQFIDRIMSFFIEILSQPDHMNLWVPFAVTTARGIIKRHHIDLIYTTSPPHSQLLTGYLLKKMTNLPWIADLRDPILLNIGSVNWKNYERAANRFLEKLTLGNTDAIITNTRAARDALTLKSNHPKIVCVPNSFDEDDFRELPAQKYPKFTISHLGTVYKFRNSEVLFEVIAFLLRSGQIRPEKFEVRFYGIIGNVLPAMIKKYKLWEYIKIKSLVSHREALEIMKKSHMLLLLKGFDAKGLGQVPGKLFEYLGTGNPILYIGPEKCEAAEIVQETGNGYVTGGDRYKIKEAIEAGYSGYRECRENRNLLRGHKEALRKYSSLEMARNMQSLFNLSATEIAN